MPPRPPPGYVHLLFQANPFYLEIPIAIVVSVCLHPRKYLRYLGWCVLGVVGVLQDGQGTEVALNGELLDRGVYRYSVPGPDPLAHAVDLEVIKQRSQVPSQTTQTRNDFSTRVQARDGCCVWTGSLGEGMHIIPHARGNEWFQCIIDNRPHDENLNSLTIDDTRNGIYAAADIHISYFEPRSVVILKTPNLILETTDVPDRFQRVIEADVRYPTNSRYTLQWIVTPDSMSSLGRVPNNNDATFKNQRMRKPADLLLHYNYGAAVVRQWGKNAGVLANRPGVPRPPALVPAPPGRPPLASHDRQLTIDRRAAAMRRGGRGVGRGSGRGRGRGQGRGHAGEGAAADSKAQDEWDEDDVMLFFWGNSKTARERHAQKEQERIAYMENWRAGVTGNPTVE